MVERDDQDERSWRLWLTSFAVALLAHGALATGVLSKRAQEPDAIGQGEPMLIELAVSEPAAVAASAAPATATEPVADRPNESAPSEPERSEEPEPEPEPVTEPEPEADPGPGAG